MGFKYLLRRAVFPFMNMLFLHAALEGSACQVRELVNVDEKGMATPVLLPCQWLPPDYECLMKRGEERIF